MTDAQVKASAAAYGLLFQQPEAEVSEPTQEPKEESKNATGSDPTIAHAGLTEIDEGSTKPFMNGHSEDKTAQLNDAADVADSAANAAGENQWDPENTNTNNLAESQEWVNVPRDPAETETGLTATPAAPSNTQSWADDHPEPAAEVTAATTQTESDGFQAVHRHRGRGDREGHHHGRGGRGGERGHGHHHRGRGAFRGEGRGRGRGGERGAYRGRGGPRRGGAGAGAAPAPAEES